MGALSIVGNLIVLDVASCDQGDVVVGQAGLTQRHDGGFGGIHIVGAEYMTCLHVGFSCDEGLPIFAAMR